MASKDQDRQFSRSEAPAEAETLVPHPTNAYVVHILLELKVKKKLKPIKTDQNRKLEA